MKIKFLFRHANNLFKRIKQKRDYIKLCNRLPLDSNLIFIESFQGRNLSDNPKAIYLELLNNNKYKNFNFIISMKDVPKNSNDFYFNDRTIIVESKSNQYYEKLAQSKYVIANSVFDLSFKKRDNQIYLQTWHGTPLKKLGWDLNTKGSNQVNKPWQIREMYKQDAKRYDLMCSPSKFYTKHITSAFALEKWHKEAIVKETGYPRADFLINHTDTNVKEIKEKYKLPSDKKIILYAPTWREDNYSMNKGYHYDIELDLERLRKEFSDEYVIVLKIHYLISDYLKINNDEFIYDLSSINDISELYIISDILITDYSSALFDFALLKRPMIFYMYDFDKYKNETRGFYLDVETLPGPITKTNDELVYQIKNIDDVNIKYQNKIIDFNKIYNYLEDGKSSERVIEELLKTV
ncbi:CDP-glycerol glycerophosphotransferase [Bacilli bacterium PM5-3]|nr:CDP-glycerol glycerophosphotransferase [Bacilli bacterium PM5-3]